MVEDGGSEDREACEEHEVRRHDDARIEMREGLVEVGNLHATVSPTRDESYDVVILLSLRRHSAVTLPSLCAP